VAKARRQRKQYTVAQRAEILAAATKDGLTANQVQKKFGVRPVTYYSWRKKAGATGRRGRPPRVGRVAAAAPTTDLSTHVRQEVAQRVREILPNIVRTEVNSYLDSLFGSSRGGRRKRR
jgi:transposase-like protein